MAMQSAVSLCISAVTLLASHYLYWDLNLFIYGYRFDQRRNHKDVIFLQFQCAENVETMQTLLLAFLVAIANHVHLGRRN